MLASQQLGRIGHRHNAHSVGGLRVDFSHLVLRVVVPMFPAPTEIADCVFQR